MYVSLVQPRSPLATGLNQAGENFYFVHSFHCVPTERSVVLAECDYGGAFCAAELTLKATQSLLIKELLAPVFIG